jgi:hypothetical protein
VNDPQNDVASVTFRAYRSERRAAECLDNALAGLGIVASQALFATSLNPAPPLAPLLAGLRSVFPIIEDLADRDLEADAEQLAAVFHDGALSGTLDFAGAAGGRWKDP